MQEAIQQTKAGDPFQDITGSDVEDASAEEMHLDDSSDEELDRDDVEIYNFFSSLDILNFLGF